MNKLLIGAFILLAIIGAFIFVGKQDVKEKEEQQTSSKSERTEVQSSKSLDYDIKPTPLRDVRSSPRFAKVNIEKRHAQMGTVEEEERGRVILTPEEVLRRAGEPSGREGEDQTIRESLNKEEWNGHAYLLVEALEKGKGLELSHEQVMDFLNGNQEEWDSNYYRWIADELMTALREDMPETTLEDLASLVGNTNLDDAIRGYSLQHVGHLADQGVNVEGALDLLWQSAKGGDPDLESTGLIGLYQFSQLHPDQQPIEPVMELAEMLLLSEDRNTSVTANGIFKTIVNQGDSK